MLFTTPCTHQRNCKSNVKRYKSLVPYFPIGMGQTGNCVSAHLSTEGEMKIQPSFF